MRFFAVLAALGSLLGASSLTPQAPPNVLVLILDDVALSDVDRLELPTLDRLAEAGVSFRRAYSMPICGPTRYTLMFGRYQRAPLGRPCRDAVKEAPDTALFSLPKLMKNRGYATGAFGKWHVGSNRDGAWEATPGLHGFDVWRAISPSNVTRCGGNGYSKWTRVDDGQSRLSTEYHTLAVRDELLGWWRATEGPKFAYVAFQTPHKPVHVPPAELLPADYPEPRTNREKFEAMLLSGDLVIGQILDAVDLTNTWVFVLGDNGTPTESVRADQNLGNVKQSTFEDGVRVPFLVHGPGLEHGFRTEALIHTVDLLATLAELTGAPLPAGTETDSLSFAACLRDPAARARSHVYVEYDMGDLMAGGGRPRAGNASHRRRAVITERWKLRRVGSIEELYDLKTDPGELAPLPTSGNLEAQGLDERTAAVVAELRQALDELEGE